MSKRKKTITIVVSVLCALSLILNAVFFISHENAKNSFFGAMHQDLMNASVLIESLYQGDSSDQQQDANNREYLMGELEETFKSLNEKSGDLGSIKLISQSGSQFQNFFRAVEGHVSSGDIEALKVEEGKLHAYIESLSIDGGQEIYGGLRPNYSLSINDIFFQTDQFLKEYPTSLPLT